VVLKSICAVLATALALALGGAAMADEYRPDEYLGLDLSKAILSPKRLGPATQFAPVPVEASGDRGSDVQARAAFGDVPKKIAAERVRISGPRQLHANSERPRGAVRTSLAHRQGNPGGNPRGNARGNPLDAQAMDTRIQTWPCKSGGICNWKH
jgi:hypothetical protein